jgi:hypothetical protein
MGGGGLIHNSKLKMAYLEDFGQQVSLSSHQNCLVWPIITDGEDEHRMDITVMLIGFCGSHIKEFRSWHELFHLQGKYCYTHATSH